MIKQGRYVSPDTHGTRMDTKPMQPSIVLLIVGLVLLLAIGGAWLYFQSKEYGTGDTEDTGTFPSSMENLQRE